MERTWVEISRPGNDATFVCRSHHYGSHEDVKVVKLKAGPVLQSIPSRNRRSIPTCHFFPLRDPRKVVLNDRS